MKMVNSQPKIASDISPDRYLVVAPYFPRIESDPLISGMVNNPAYLWSRVAELGHDVTVLTYGTPSGKWVYRKVKVISVGACPFKGVIRSLCIEIKLLLWVIREGIRGRFDQIRIHHFGGFSIFLLKALGIINSAIAVTAHGTTLPEISANTQATGRRDNPSRIVRLSRWLQYRLDRMLYAMADVLVSPSRFQVHELIHQYGVVEQRIAVLPHGYDESHFRSHRKSAEALRERLGIGTQESIVLMVARAAPKKGVDKFIEAARIIESLDTNSAIRFIAVVGDPLHRSAEIDLEGLSDNSSGSFLLQRNVPEDELPSYYSAARICVVPSVGYESVPSVVYEACACGCTVLATRLPGIEEVVDGVFLDEPAPHMIANKVIEILKEGLQTSFTHNYALGQLLPKQMNVGRLPR